MGNSQGGWTRSHKSLEDIILMGDSILDDFYWCNDHKKDVEHQLIATFKNEITITNLALDETTLDDLLHGKKPNDKYVKARKEMGLSPYQVDAKDGKVYPLKLLQNLILSETIRVPPSKADMEKEKSLFKGTKNAMSPATPDSSDSNLKSPNSSKAKKKEIKSLMRPIVVLSVGFNDILNHLSYGQFDLIIGALEENKFKENFDKIVSYLVKNLSLEVILVLSYEPHETFFESQLHFCRDDLLLLMEWYAKYMFRIGENYNIPVIDLSRTMNPFDKSHYGQSPTQPSNKAGQFIVDLIVHSIANFNFESADRFAMVFYGTQNIQCLKCDKNARSGYLRELQKIMPSEQMGMNELDLLGDLFAEDDAKESENKNSTSDKPVETTKRKWSLLKQKNKGGNNNGNASTNGSNGNTPDIDASKNDDDKTMDQILFETELDPNMKFFSTYDSKPQTGTDYSDLPAQTRSRNKHSLFDTQNDTILKSYTNNDKKTDDNETNNTTNNTTNTTTTTTTNTNANTIPTINENTNETKEKEKENENGSANETESKIEDTSNITRHRAQAHDQDHSRTSLMSTTTASENSENIEHVQNRSSRRIAVADMSAAMESMNSNSNTVTNTIITTSSSSNTNDDTTTNTNTSSPDFPRISRPRMGYDASA